MHQEVPDPGVLYLAKEDGYVQKWITFSENRSMIVRTLKCMLLMHTIQSFPQMDSIEVDDNKEFQRVLRPVCCGKCKIKWMAKLPWEPYREPMKG